LHAGPRRAAGGAGSRSRVAPRTRRYHDRRLTCAPASYVSCWFVGRV